MQLGGPEGTHAAARPLYSSEGKPMPVRPDPGDSWSKWYSCKPCVQAGRPCAVGCGRLAGSQRIKVGKPKTPWHERGGLGGVPLAAKAGWLQGYR